jgi:two-component system, response regulator RegA
MKTVLIIDDDKDFAESLERSFLRRDFAARAVNGVKEAAEIIQKFHPRFVVIDLKMSGESGLEGIKIIRDFDPTIKIVMLTGYASITTTIEAIKLGACYYLAKPASVDAIIAAFNDEVAEKVTAKKTSLKNIEWEYIHKALLETNFNISKAARLLGIHRRTLARKLEKKRL